MGVRKRNRANQIKEEKQKKYYAVLKNCPTSPRKMRLVADQVRGEEVNRALDILKFNQKEASRRLEKLILSAISNWQTKNEGVRIEDSSLFVKEIFVDSGKGLEKTAASATGESTQDQEKIQSYYRHSG